ncbi:hypothetical protein BDP27DRAFT_1524002, partial [Rhodocollybia butyracea]
LKVENLYFSERKDHIHIRPYTSKSKQHGGVEGFDLYFETEEGMIPLCVCRALRDWLRITGITTGYLFPRMYDYNRLGPSQTHMDQSEFLQLFRNMLMDIGQDPDSFGIHALRRGGCQWMFQDVRMSLPDVLNWEAGVLTLLMP